MQKTTETVRFDWVMPLLAIALALTITLGVGFLTGQQAPSATDDMSAICRQLSQAVLPADCIALRAAVATERATSISQWMLWVSFGSLVASAGALVGLIIAFTQGQRTIMLAIEANRISINNSQTQARAYLVVQSVECQINNQGKLSTRVKFQNSGLSPARRMRWLYNASLDIVVDKNERIKLTLGEKPDLDNSHWRQDIPSAGTWTSIPKGLGGPHSLEVRSKIKQASMIAITVKIEADYQDVFGSTHRENACFKGRLDIGRFIELDRAHDKLFDEQADRMTS